MSPSRSAVLMLPWLSAVLPGQHVWSQIDGPTLVGYPLFAPGAAFSRSAFDGARQRLVVVDHGERLFEHDGTRWLFRGLAGNAAFLVFDPVRRRTLRGIVDPGGLRLASWDGVVWTAEPGLLAGLGGYGAPAFDPVRSRLVLPGNTGTGWAIHEWDGLAWQSLASLPAGAYGQALAYDPVQARTLLRLPTTPGADDLWGWDGASLALLGSLGGTFRCLGAFWNPVAQRLELVGDFTSPPYASGLFAWNGSAVVPFAAFPPVAIAPFSSACGDAQGRVHLVGEAWLTGLGAVHVFANGSWQPNGDGNGSVRNAGGMSFAPTFGQLVFTGGFVRFDRFAGTSLWDGARWSWSASAPTPLRGHTTCAPDPLGRGVVLFGGEADTGNPFGYAVRGDLWLWNGSTWSGLVGGPPARSFCAMALDSARQRLVLCGGQGSTTGVPFALQDTWEWDGVTWSARAPLPQALARHALAFDAARGRTLLFGGSSPTGFRDDTYAWDGVAWTGLQPPLRPPAGLPAMAYDPDRGVVTLVVHHASGIQAWHWNGSLWTQDPAPLPPVVSLSALVQGGHAPQVVFDSARRRLLYHNGVALFAYSPTPAGAVAYGSGCGRSLGFVLAHPPRPGGVLQGDLLGAVPAGLVAVGLGLAAGSQNLGNGCALLLQGGLGSQLAWADADGFASVRWSVPNTPALRGTAVFVQGAVLDPGAPGGIGLTHGLAVTVGD